MRWRLTAWVAGVMMVAVAATFVVVYENTGTELRAQIDRDLAGDTTQLSQSLGSRQGRTAHVIAAAAERYVSAQAYTANSTVLFALVPGALLASNHPELFGASGPDEGETVAEQAKENESGRKLLVPRIGYSTERLPDVGPVRVLERSVLVSGMAVVVGAGEPLALVEHAQDDVAAAFVLAATLAIGLALVVSYLAGARVSAPLRRMASVAARVDAGELEPRMEVSSGERGEVRVLAVAFNHMLDRLAEAFGSQREFIADASHELRTPLTVIRGQLEVLAAERAPSHEDVRRVDRLVGAEIVRITRLVDDLLLLARSEQRNFLGVESIDVRPFVCDLWEGLSVTAERRFELGAVADGTLRADPDRLAQALRNLGRNAIEHTSEGGLVRLAVDPASPGKLRFSVLDDGPGIPLEERERIFERFHRTDPGRARSAGGAGLGLAIVRAIADAHGGEVRALDSPNGSGAWVELVMPGFAPSQQRDAVLQGRGQSF